METIEQRNNTVDVIKGIAVAFMVFQHVVSMQVPSLSFAPQTIEVLTWFATFFCAPAFAMMYGYGIGRVRDEKKVLKQSVVLLSTSLFLYIFMFFFTRPGYQLLILVDFAIAGLIVQYFMKKKPSRRTFLVLVTLPLVLNVFAGQLGVGIGVLFSSPDDSVPSLLNYPVVALMSSVFAGAYIRQYGMPKFKYVTLAGLMLLTLLATTMRSEYTYSATLFIGTWITFTLWSVLEYAERIQDIGNQANINGKTQSLYYADHAFAWLGQNILSIYVVHQVLIISVLYAFGKAPSMTELGSQDIAYAYTTGQTEASYWAGCTVAVMIVTCVLVWVSKKFKKLALLPKKVES